MAGEKKHFLATIWENAWETATWKPNDLKPLPIDINLEGKADRDSQNAPCIHSHKIEGKVWHIWRRERWELQTLRSISDTFAPFVSWMIFSIDFLLILHISFVWVDDIRNSTYYHGFYPVKPLKAKNMRNTIRYWKACELFVGRICAALNPQRDGDFFLFLKTAASFESFEASSRSHKQIP
jgi:hypothetical protein